MSPKTLKQYLQEKRKNNKTEAKANKIKEKDAKLTHILSMKSRKRSTIEGYDSVIQAYNLSRKEFLMSLKECSLTTKHATILFRL